MPLKHVTLMAAVPDAGRLSALLRDSILNGTEGEEQRVLRDRLPSGNWIACTVNGNPSHSLPVTRHLPLLDACVGEVERTASEHIPFARVLELAEQAQVRSNEILRLAFLLSMNWQDGNSDCTRHVSAIYRYSSPEIKPKVVPMPDPSLVPDFGLRAFRLREMEPGIMFSRDMVELWRGRYNFRVL